MDNDSLSALLREARAGTLSLFMPLEGDELFGREQHHLEPPIWEMGHVAWFHEYYLLRGLAKEAPLMPHGDGIYDSFRVSYKKRWQHDFPSKQETLDYAEKVLDACTERLAGPELSAEEAYVYELCAQHEFMHTENMAIVRRNLGIGDAPQQSVLEVDMSFVRRDIEVPGGRFPLGAREGQGFVLDNEQWQHEVDIAPFAIANTPVTNAEFSEFLDAGGYLNRSLWTKDGWNWRRRQDVSGPLYWQRIEGRWHENHYGSWEPIRPYHPVCHINLHEARAYCRFAKRRLPTEAEWEMAASWNPKTNTKTTYPWGERSPGADLVHMKLGARDTVDVRALPAGDSPLGCRQMIGNVWEWTSSKLVPYPGFAPGPYAEYSAPYLGKKPVLRGGCWATNPRLIRNTWRNFYIRQRRNIFAGLRTCAI